MSKALELIKKTLEKNCCLADLEEELNQIESQLSELEVYKKLEQLLGMDFKSIAAFSDLEGKRIYIHNLKHDVEFKFELKEYHLK